MRDGDSERDLHASDLSFHAPHRPDLVVYPGSTDEVALVLALANEHRIPVTPFGVGTSLEGHVIPVHGGISLDLSRLDRILDISPENLTATVQAGVTRLTLERAAGQHGLFFPVDPGADATLGGMAATNAAGTTTVRYGKTRANVLALEAVLADGRVIRTGSSAAKTSAGYDLTGLLVGSEGTLAVITEVTVRLHAIPEHAVALRISFPDIESACRTAAGVVAAGSGVTRIEFLDAWIVAAVNAYSETSYPEEPCLFVEASGSEELVLADLELVQAIATAEGATEIVTERDPDARARLWKARHDAAHATAAMFPGTKERATDVCVPLTELAGAAHFARAEIDRLGLNAGIVGHAGDGNLHIAVQVDAAEIGLSEELVHNVVDDALARGGTCTGEHGDRPRQDRGARAGARRPDPADARDQGELRPERDPQPRQGAAGDRSSRCRPQTSASGTYPARRRHRRHVHRRRAARRRRLGADEEGAVDAGRLRPRRRRRGRRAARRVRRRGGRDRRRRARLDGRLEHDPRGPRRADGADHDGGLPRRPRDAPAPDPRPLRHPVREPDAARPAATPVRGRRAARPARRGLARARRGRASREVARRDRGRRTSRRSRSRCSTSYADDAHERRVEEIVRAIVGEDVYVTRSSEILPEIREYERTSTAVVNAYVGPAITRYIALARGAAARGGHRRHRSR